MKVKATKAGYYGLKRVKANEVFTISDEKNPEDMPLVDLKGQPVLDKAGNPIKHPRAGKAKEFSPKWMVCLDGSEESEPQSKPEAQGDVADAEIAPKRRGGRPRKTEV